MEVERKLNLSLINLDSATNWLCSLDQATSPQSSSVSSSKTMELKIIILQVGFMRYLRERLYRKVLIKI